MSFRVKLTLIVLIAVIVPVLSMSITTHIFSKSTRAVAFDAAEQLADADLEHIIDSLVTLANSNQEAIAVQRATSVKNYLRAIADSLYLKISKSYEDGSRTLDAATIRKELLRERIGVSGYAFGMNKAGVLTIHPKSEGKNLAGKKHIDEMRDKKNGYIEYHSVTTKRDKAVYYRYFEPLDLIIAPGVFINELEHLYDLDGENSIRDKFNMKLSSFRIGSSGFVWVQDAKLETPELLVKPNGATASRFESSLSVEFLRELSRTAINSEGKLLDKKVQIVNPYDGKKYQTMIRYTYFAPNESVFVTAIPEKDSMSAAEAVGTSFKKLQNLVIILSVVIGLLIIVLALWFGQKTIVTPVRKVLDLVVTVSKGNFNSRLDLNQKDEIGQLGDALNIMSEHLGSHASIAEKIAHGDFRVDVRLASESDELGQSLRKMVSTLNVSLAQVSGAAEQIASGGTQVSASSQSLSQGATQQASSLEEISSSMVQMGGQTKQNAENAGKANRLSHEAHKAAETGNQQVENMVTAMNDINESGQNISKIIKTIDDIAFQTNILALNAAVEAARAGRFGKGFAVVAEEVRSLAIKSASAAKETEELIEESINRTENGAKIAEQTAEALRDITERVKASTDLVTHISTASNEQAQGISQISLALEQIDQVTHQNTASAEESAAASEELSGLAGELKQMLGRFQLKKQAGSNQTYTDIDPIADEQSVNAQLAWGHTENEAPNDDENTQERFETQSNMIE